MKNPQFQKKNWWIFQRTLADFKNMYSWIKKSTIGQP